ncbi:copia protein [Tanacetum coccineum]
MIVAGAENHPPMLDKTMYNSWQSRMLLYIKEKKNGRMMLESIENGPLVYPTVKERVQLNISGIESSYSCKALNCHIKNVNADCTTSLISLLQSRQVQVNTKFLNALQPEWSKFVTDVKLAKNMYTTNYDQLYAYICRHEGHGQRFAGSSIKGNVTSSGGNNVAGRARVVKCYNCEGEGHMARQCTQPKKPRNSTWFKEKMLLVHTQESGQVLDEEQSSFLADPGVADLNKLADDFGKHFDPQKELSVEQAFWLQFSSPISEQPVVQTTAVRTEAPSELLKEYTDKYSENLVFKAELAKKEHMVENKFFDEVILRCSRLKNCYVNLELKLQHQKESFLNNRSFNNQNAPGISKFFKINEWQAKLDTKDVSIANLRKHIESLKGKNVIEKDATPNNATILAPRMFKLY